MDNKEPRYKNEIAKCLRCKKAHLRVATYRRFYVSKVYLGEVQKRAYLARVGNDLPLLCCGREWHYRTIDGVKSERHPCDERCTSAKGHKCECSCGGKNHGSEHS